MTTDPITEFTPIPGDPAAPLVLGFMDDHELCDEQLSAAKAELEARPTREGYDEIVRLSHEFRNQRNRATEEVDGLRARIAAALDIDWAAEINWSNGSAHYTDVEVRIRRILDPDAA